MRKARGKGTVSHEIFARATPTQVERALASLGDAEVHLVLSVRDLVRQIPAEWQENVKHRSHITYAKFLRTIRDPARDSRIGSWFWAVQEIPDILERWGSSLPPERVHLVTLPPPGADRGELWRRFSRTFGLDGLPLDLTAERENPSLGVPETSLLRTINERVTSIIAPPDYRPLVRETLAHQTLSRSVTSARLGLAPEDHAWARELAERWIEVLAERGYDVAGSLDDLLGPDAGTFADPDSATADELLPPALDAISALLVEAARLRAVEERLHGEVRRGPRGARPGAGDPGRSAPGARWSPPSRTVPPAGLARRLPAPARAQGLTRAPPVTVDVTSGLPPTRQHLAVGVATDAPGRVAVGTHADHAADHGDLPAEGGRQPLAGDPRDDVGGDDRRDDAVDGRVVHRGRGDRHGRRWAACAS